MEHTLTNPEWSQATFSSSKQCTQCNEMKPFDPMAVKYTKASGFHGSKCWDCYVKNQREYIQEWRRAKPEYTREYYYNVLKPKKEANAT